MLAPGAHSHPSTTEPHAIPSPHAKQMVSFLIPTPQAGSVPQSTHPVTPSPGSPRTAQTTPFSPRPSSLQGTQDKLPHRHTADPSNSDTHGARRLNRHPEPQVRAPSPQVPLFGSTLQAFARVTVPPGENTSRAQHPQGLLPNASQASTPLVSAQYDRGRPGVAPAPDPPSKAPRPWARSARSPTRSSSPPQRTPSRGSYQRAWVSGALRPSKGSQSNTKQKRASWGGRDGLCAAPRMSSSCRRPAGA